MASLSIKDAASVNSAMKCMDFAKEEGASGRFEDSWMTAVVKGRSWQRSFTRCEHGSKDTMPHHLRQLFSQDIGDRGMPSTNSETLQCSNRTLVAKSTFPDLQLYNLEVIGAEKRVDAAVSLR